MDTIVYIDPYSKFFPLRIFQKPYIALLKLMIRIISFTARASWYRVVRFALDLLGMIFLIYPKNASRKKVTVAGMPAEWLWWQGSDDKGTILYIHGGGYSLGSLKTHRQMASMITRYCKRKALIIRYPLAPEHPFPAALDHALKAYQWLLKEGTAPEKIVVMGDSSGGGMAIALLQTLRDRGIPFPGCGVFVSPWTDLACTGESMRTRACSDPMLRKRVILPFARLYAADTELTNPGVSPLYGSMMGLPRLLFMVGYDEILMDDSLRIPALPHDGDIRVEVWKGMFHVWPIFYAYAPFFKKAFAHIRDFVDGE
jgi:epsilon-lactone hydrolase